MGEIVDAIAAAPGRAGGWQDALAKLGERTGCSGGQLLAIGGPLPIPFNRCRASHRATPALVLGEESRAGAGTRVLTTRLVGLNGAPTFDTHPSLRAALGSSRGDLFGIALLRRSEDGPVRPAQRAVLEESAEAIIAALRLQQHCEDRAARHMTRTFETIGLAALVFDAGGRLRATSERAAQQLEQAADLRLVDGRIKGLPAEDQVILDEALSAALGPGNSGAADRARTFALGRHGSRTGKAIVFTVIRREPDEASISHLPHALVLMRGRAPSVPPREVVRRVFELTAGEAEVALMIADGKGREAIAAARGVAPATVHAQLRSIFAKVGVNRELALALRIRELMEI